MSPLVIVHSLALESFPLYSVINLTYNLYYTLYVLCEIISTDTWEMRGVQKKNPSDIVTIITNN